jgi:EmrB/QacA subfamily drug resistance transporter
MKGLSYKWIVATVVIFGIFMSILDTTIVNIAIPRLQTAFGAGLTDVDWVATGYTLAEGAGTPLTPFFSAFLGTKRFYLMILALFTIGSALCGLAWSLSALVTFRIMQGVAGACMLPMSITLLYTEFPPEERGTAMGALGIPIMLAPALGPTVGGYIVTYASWQLLFYINVPIGIVGFIMAAIFLHDAPPQGNRYFDVAGFIFSTGGLASLLYAFSDAGTDGWSSAKVMSFLIIGVSSLAIFVLVEFLVINSGKQPLLDVRVFGNLSFAGGNIAMVMVIFALYGGLFLVPVYLQDLRGLSAYDSGLVLLPQALGSMVASLVGGRLVDKLGVKAVVIPGLLILCWALWDFGHITLNTPYSYFQWLLILRGFGLGFSMQPLLVAALAEIKPAQMAQGSSINSVLRSVTSALAVALVSTLVTTQTKVHYVRLAEKVTVDSPAGQFLHQMAGFFSTLGMNQHNAMTAAIQEMYGVLQSQAYMLAMQDVFLITMVVSALSILIVLFLVRSPRKKAVDQGKRASGALDGHAGGSEAEEAEEEHMAFMH